MSTPDPIRSYHEAGKPIVIGLYVRPGRIRRAFTAIGSAIDATLAELISNRPETCEARGEPAGRYAALQLYCGRGARHDGLHRARLPDGSLWWWR